MELNVTSRFEIKARVFQIVTGLLAPGKDSPACAGDDMAIRQETWREWNDLQGRVVDLTINAVEEVLWN